MPEGFGGPSDGGDGRIWRSNMVRASERERMIARDATIRDAKHWLEREEEARSVADDLSDPDAKRLMLSIAEGYREMAEHAERATKC